jgi:hypothetical protein
MEHRVPLPLDISLVTPIPSVHFEEIGQAEPEKYLAIEKDIEKMIMHGYKT